MMQLVVPEVLSLLCAKLVKAMAALISLQYVSSLPFSFSFCTAPTPPLPLVVKETQHREDREGLFTATVDLMLYHNHNDQIHVVFWLFFYL